MQSYVKIEVGAKNYYVHSNVLPPVGETIIVDKRLCENGISPELEVVAHEWKLEPSPDVDGNPVLYVTIKTRTLEE